MCMVNISWWLCNEVKFYDITRKKNIYYMLIWVINELHDNIWNFKFDVIFYANSPHFYYHVCY